MEAAAVLLLLGCGGLAAGILIGRYYVPDDRMLKRTARHARSYMRAINHLLSRETDEAIDELRAVVAENVDDIEPYFALGALFRSRGEWERAIRVHQAIDLREGSSKKIRVRALYELGLDFRSAGMPRRSTRAMEQVLAEEPKQVGALRALCGLYEEQGRYAEAADAWRRLHKLRGDGRADREHHLLVAAAQKATGAGDYDSGKRLLRDAEKLTGPSAHLLAAAAELAAAKGNAKGASARLRQALAAAPDLSAYLVPGLIEAERVLVVERAGKKGEGPEEGSAVPLEDWQQARATETAIAGLLEVLEALGGSSAHLELAIAELRAQVDPPAALEDYRRLAAREGELLPARVAAARLALAGGDAERIREELDDLAGADGALDWAANGVWRCGHCGQRDEEFFWRCPRCRRWGSVCLDVGRDAIEPPPPPPRERRELPRGGPSLALLGTGADGALPEPTLDHGLSVRELRNSERRPTVLGRFGTWISGTVSGKRGRRAEPPDPGE